MTASLPMPAAISDGCDTDATCTSQAKEHKWMQHVSILAIQMQRNACSGHMDVSILALWMQRNGCSGIMDSSILKLERWFLILPQFKFYYRNYAFRGGLPRTFRE